MARTNGGIIGKRNITSFGKCTTTTITSSGNHTTQPGTRLVGGVYVAGGGGGGGRYGGGGGGGGLIMTPFSCGLPVCGNTAYPVVVGAGGAGGVGGANGTTGVDTTGFGFTAKGGGKGAHAGQGPATDGGSGGGSGNACRPNCTAGVGTQPTQPGLSGAFGFGNRGGGSLAPGSAPDYAQGGGGGAGSAGNIATNPPLLGGVGGNGKDVTPLYSTGGTYAGGGGGGAQSGGAGSNGGPGGAGDAGNSPGQSPYTGEAGTANTGGGGGGASARPSPTDDQTRPGGTGGSGIVIVKELNKASGVWNLRSQLRARQQGTWPVRSVGSFNANYLVVAGGGGGGQRGGGGAGGFRLFTCQPFTGFTDYSVTIGAGGSGSSQGANSVFRCNTSTGGGFGGKFASSNPAPQRNGGDGGSGGGGGGNLISTPGLGGSGNTPPTSPSQGNDGAPGFTDQANFTFGGGGGGAAGAGSGGPSTNKGSPNAGGAGSPVTSTFGCAPQPFYPVSGPGEGYFAGGGGGFQDVPVPAGPTPSGSGAGGIGGGGTNITCGTVTVATANSGGGGAGGQSGASGIVLIKFPSAATPGIALSPGCNSLVTQPDGTSVAHIITSGTVSVT